MCSDLRESVFRIDDEKTGLPASACQVMSFRVVSAFDNQTGL